MFFCQNLPQFIERAKYKQQKIDHNLYEKKIKNLGQLKTRIERI